MKRLFLLALVGLFAAASSAQADLVWIGSNGGSGGGDGVSGFQEANWVVVDNITGATSVPPPNSINGGQNNSSPITAVQNETIIVSSSDPLYIAGSGQPGNLGGTNEFSLGDNDLLVSGLRLGISGAGAGGLIGFGASANNVLVENGGDLEFQFLNSVLVSIDTGSTVTLRGGADPIANGATIDLLDTSSVLEFQDETFAAFNSEHLGDVTFNGAALVFGSDPFVIEAGDNAVASAFNGNAGVAIQGVAVVVPEPTSAGVLLLAFLGCVTRRSRK